MKVVVEVDGLLTLSIFDCCDGERKRERAERGSIDSRGDAGYRQCLMLLIIPF